ncbi:hypothetical protein DUI87_24793 [Hirundo rustica rustica]|uniref:Uncharacterized protein n=1 Tax=Hirundo rustica rustica TaxID=333673 RepID=A0A3M0JBM4_HIRRU|nr:hypothetical protein DUI87_24793 [Hirundo rustica rustica]
MILLEDHSGLEEGSSPLPFLSQEQQGGQANHQLSLLEDNEKGLNFLRDLGLYLQVNAAASLLCNNAAVGGKAGQGLQITLISGPLLAVPKLISSDEKCVLHQAWLRLHPAWILLHLHEHGRMGKAQANVLQPPFFVCVVRHGFVHLRAACLIFTRLLDRGLLAEMGITESFSLEKALKIIESKFSSSTATPPLSHIPKWHILTSFKSLQRCDNTRVVLCQALTKPSTCTSEDKDWDISKPIECTFGLQHIYKALLEKTLRKNPTSALQDLGGHVGAQQLKFRTRHPAQPVTLERMGDIPLTPLATPGRINLRTLLDFSTPTGYWSAVVTLMRDRDILGQQEGKAVKTQLPGDASAQTPPEGEELDPV